MSRKANFFERVRLHPSQLRTVAQRRCADAEALCATGRNERANGAMYLAGFTVECLLKAKLLDKHKWLGSAASPAGRKPNEQRIWSLCYRSHDLDEILSTLPDVVQRLAGLEQRGQLRLVQSLKSICSEWTIFARYSPRSSTIPDAYDFVLRVKELKEWLR